MGFSKHLRDALRQGIFTPSGYGHEMENPSGRTNGNGIDPKTAPYTDKVDDGYDDGYNYDADVSEITRYSNFSVTASMRGILNPSFRSRITDAEYNELQTFMTDTTNHKCELRIIVQNQRKTRRGHRNSDSVQYPSGQNSILHTPGDLSDVASILGYRGLNNVNYYNDMITGPTTAGGSTPGYVHRRDPMEIRINDLNNQSGHHPAPTGDNHVHPVISGHFSAWGYASILDAGNSTYTDINGDKINLAQQMTHSPTYAPNITGCFATAGYNYQVNLNFTKLGTDNALNVEGCLFPIDDNNCFYDNSGFNTYATKAPTLDLIHADSAHGGVASYEWKKSIVGNDLNRSSDGYADFYFPIMFQAIKTLRRRWYTTYNTYIPDSFNYTIGLVFYTKVQGTNHTHGKVYDIIFDRLRVIDRYDIESFINFGDGGNFQNHIRPNTIIIRGTNGSNGYATFSHVPLDGMTKVFYTFDRPIMTDYGLANGNNVKTEQREFVNFHSGICYLKSGGGVLGQTFLRNQPDSSYLGAASDISASYTPGNETLTICTSTHNMQSNTAPLFIFTE